MTKNEENGPIHLQNAHTKGSQRRAFGHWGPLWARISGNEPAHGLDWANWFDFVEYSGLGCEFDWLRRGLGEILGEREGKKTEVLHFTNQKHWKAWMIMKKWSQHDLYNLIGWPNVAKDRTCWLKTIPLHFRRDSIGFERRFHCILEEIPLDFKSDSIGF